MKGAIFSETLRRNWRQILWWGVGIGALGLYIGVFTKDVDVLKQYAEVVKAVPPALIQMFGIDDPAAMGTPEGFIAFGFFGYTLLIYAVFAVFAGLNVTANEEDEGIMDVLLSLPVARSRVVLEKLAAYVVLVLAIVLISFGGLWAGMQSSASTVSMTRLAESSINMIPGILLMLTFTVFIATTVRRKSTATAIVAVFIIASYFVDFLGGAASGTLADTLRAISYFSYYDAAGVMKNGLDVGSMTLLLAVSAAFVVGSLWMFNRRDVGV